LVHAPTAAALQVVKSGRKKHRGNGNATVVARQEQPLSLPLVYEHVEGEGLEEQHGP
jgi:hypothetical protein